MAKRILKKKWSVSGALGSEVKIANGRFGTIQTKQKVKLNDFKTINYISGPIPENELAELLGFWKRKTLARERDSKLDIYNDDPYYMGYNGCTTNCPEEDVWKRREERPLNTTPVTHVKETVLQNNWREKKKRPLPEIPVEECSLRNGYDQIDDLYSETGLSTERDSDFECSYEHAVKQNQCTEQLYLYDDTSQLDAYETFPRYTLNRKRNLTDRPPLDVPTHPLKNLYDKPLEGNQTNKKDSIFHRQMGATKRTNVKPTFCEKSGPKQNVFEDHFYTKQDSCGTCQPSTGRSDEYLNSVTRSITIMKLAMPTITWATQRPSTENSEDGSRCTSASSSFINIDCCDNRTVETRQDALDSPTMSSSSSFIKIEIHSKSPERKKLNDRPPPIPERPIVSPNWVVDDRTIADSTKRKEIWDDFNEDPFPPPITPRVPIKSMDEAEMRLLMIPDQDESNDKCPVQQQVVKHKVTKQDSKDGKTGDNYSEKRTSFTLTQNLSKTDNPLENKLTTLSVLAPSKEDSNTSVYELKIQDNLDPGLTRSELKTSAIRNEALEVDKEPLVNSSSGGEHEEIRRLRTKRYALVERNMVDKEMIEEQKVINDELRQSVNIKKQLAVLQREEHALESALESIQKFGIEEDFKEQFECANEMSEIEETDTLYLTKIGSRNSFRRGFRRSRSGSVLSRRGRRSVYSIDSGIGHY